VVTTTPRWETEDEEEKEEERKEKEEKERRQNCFRYRGNCAARQLQPRARA